MLIQIAQFLLGLSLLIVLHELGHFIPAKIFKTRVEKFYLFFDYKFSLFKKKIGETTYGIGWIPLGGYVKIVGMVDESMDTDGLQKEPEPHEFRAKPGWQRLIILTGGVIVNFILAFVIYAGMMSYYGESYLEASEAKYGVWVGEGLEHLGLQNGDKIVSVGGEQVNRFSELSIAMIIGLDEEVVVDRNGEMLSFTLTDEAIGEIINQSEEAGMLLLPRMPFIVADAPDTLPAYAAGIRKDDSIVGVNNQPAFFYDQFKDEIVKHKNDTITLAYYRNGEFMSTRMYIDSTATIGVNNYGLGRYFAFTDTTYKGMSAISAGWNKATNQLSNYVDQFAIIFSPKTGAAGKLGGFKTMMSQYEEGAWNWERFWGVTAFISIMLGFLNILPIPALDGGHVLFTIVEMITGKRPPIKLLEYAQMIGFFLLMGLLIFANGNDFGLWDIFK